MTTTSFEVEPEKCSVCGNPDDEDHKQFKHPYTKPGEEWVPVNSDAKPKPSPSTARGIMVAPMPDLALRALLVRHGLISMEELKEVEDGLRYPEAASVRTDEADPGRG